VNLPGVIHAVSNADTPRRETHDFDAHVALRPHAFLQILAGEVDEDYFQQHCEYAWQLQRLAMAAAQEEQQDVEPCWDNACSSAVLEPQQLQGLVEAWGNARLLLQGKLQQGAEPSQEQQEQLAQLQEAWLAGISRHCGPGRHCAFEF
jgi:hypothetical protein